MCDTGGDKQSAILGLEDRVQILDGLVPRAPHGKARDSSPPERKSPLFKLPPRGLRGEDCR